MGDRGHPGPPGPPGEQGLPGAAGKEGAKVKLEALFNTVSFLALNQVIRVHISNEAHIFSPFPPIG